VTAIQRSVVRPQKLQKPIFFGVQMLLFGARKPELAARIAHSQCESVSRLKNIALAATSILRPVERSALRPRDTPILRSLARKPAKQRRGVRDSFARSAWGGNATKWPQRDLNLPLAAGPRVGHIGPYGAVAEWLKAAVC
jgi:hypothetical protein